jgi:hypothetical protein
MRRTLLYEFLGLLLLPILVVQAAGAQTVMPRPGAAETGKGTASIRGRVTAADTGKPLRRAQLTLVGTPAFQRYNTSTNARGEYELKGLPEGRYTLAVSRGGYLRVEYGERRPGDGGKPIQVAEGQHVDRIDVALPRAGIISGRLVDETGEPIAGVSVYAMRQSYYLGRRRLVPMGHVVPTDDTGHYRLLGLEPGEYYVMATARDTWTVKGPPPYVAGYAVTYFPGAANATSAQRVQVGSGREVPNTDFALVASRTATLSGIATRADGSPAAGGSVSLSQNIMGPLGGSSWSAAGTTAGSDGSWKLEKISPGEYELSLSVDERDRGRQRTSMQVFVQGADISGISLAADPGAEVSGEVITENGGALPAGVIGGRLRVVLEPIGPDRQAAPILSGSDIGLVGTDGRFTSKAQSGPNVLRVTGLPSRWAVRSIEVGGRNYAGAPVDVTAGKPLDGVRIVLTDNFPTVTGTVTDDRGTGAESTVVLFTTDESKWSVQESVRSSRADQYGLYRFDTVRPGEYYAIALEAVNRWQLPDPEFLSGLTIRATKVTVGEEKSEPLNLRLRDR